MVANKSVSVHYALTIGFCRIGTLWLSFITDGNSVKLGIKVFRDKKKACYLSDVCHFILSLQKPKLLFQSLLLATCSQPSAYSDNTKIGQSFLRVLGNRYFRTLRNFSSGLHQWKLMWFTMGRRKKLSDAYSYINRPHKLYLQHPAIQNISFNCIDRLYQENTFHPLLR